MPDPDENAPDSYSGSAVLGASRAGYRNHQSLKEMASEYIQEGVVSGRLGPGVKVDQDQIAEELGISRLPIREALIELTTKGYVESIPRRGAFVVKLTTQDIEDHYAVIILLFGLTARRAAEHITDEKIRILQKLHTDATNTADRSTQRTLSMEFYRIINRVGTSARLLYTLQFLASALPNDIYYSTARALAMETVYRERILTALENRDAAAAVKVTEEYFQNCAKVVIDELRSRGYWSEADKAAEAAS